MFCISVEPRHRRTRAQRKQQFHWHILIHIKEIIKQRRRLKVTESTEGKREVIQNETPVISSPTNDFRHCKEQLQLEPTVLNSVNSYSKRWLWKLGHGVLGILQLTSWQPHCGDQTRRQQDGVSYFDVMNPIVPPTVYCIHTVHVSKQLWLNRSLLPANATSRVKIDLLQQKT